MPKIIAILLWPYVFVLDFFIFLTGAQSFKDARAVSRGYFKNILSGSKSHQVYKAITNSGRRLS